MPAPAARDAPGSEVIGGEFVLGRPGGRPSTLLLHGLTGSPWDVRLIAEALADEGARVHAPLLPGHGSVEGLEASSWRDWARCSETALEHAAADGPALVIGFSMGALLALHLAALDFDDEGRPTRARPRVGAIVAMAVPLELASWQARGARALAWLRRRGFRRVLGHHRKRNGIDVRSRREKRRNPGLEAFPYSSVSELDRLQAHVRERLPRVRAPLLLLHGRHDHAAPPEHSLRVAQRVGSRSVRRVTLPGSYHLLGRDVDRHTVCDEIVRFAAETWSASA